jgi:perosamine synthetase
MNIIDGSQKSMPKDFIPLSVPEIRGNEWQYIKACLDTNWVSTAGAYVDRFEDMTARYAGVKYAVAVVNGTSALHLALLVSGVRPGEEVLVSGLTFIAPANAIHYAGARPIFMDVEPEYFQLDPTGVHDFLKRECTFRQGRLHNKASGRRIRAILAVHILGHPVEMGPLLKIAQKYNLVVIEDAAESLGARCALNPGGSGKLGERVGALGDMACFSFNGNKIITTGGGGMMVTNSESLADEARYLSTQAKDDPVEYIHDRVGYNYRLTNIQAAMGCAQMERLDDFIHAKRRIARRYTEAFHEVKGIIPSKEAPWAYSTFWMYTILVDPHDYGRDSRDLLKDLQSAGIQTRPLWQPLHLSKAHGNCRSGPMETTERIALNALCLPCSAGLSPLDQDRVIATIRSLSR